MVQTAARQIEEEEDNVSVVLDAAPAEYQAICHLSKIER